MISSRLRLWQTTAQWLQIVSKKAILKMYPARKKTLFFVLLKKNLPAKGFSQKTGNHSNLLTINEIESANKITFIGGFLKDISFTSER